MSIEAMKQALESFKKIHEGCGFVKKDNLSKESNELATLVRKDCNFAMEDLRQAIAEAEKQEPVAFRNTATGAFCTGGFLRKDWAKWQPLYPAPVHASDISQERVDETAKRKDEWVGFAHEELAWLNEALNLGGRFAVIEAIEAKLKEKNHG